MENHLQLTGERSRIVTVEVDRRCPRLSFGSAHLRGGRGALAASVRARLSLPLRVVKRQQVADVSVRHTLRQLGQHMQQIRVRFDSAGAARELCDSRTSFHFLVRLFRSVVELEAPLGDASSTTRR
jgi:hypothetical protein